MKAGKLKTYISLSFINISAFLLHPFRFYLITYINLFKSLDTCHYFAYWLHSDMNLVLDGVKVFIVYKSNILSISCLNSVFNIKFLEFKYSIHLVSIAILS